MYNGMLRMAFATSLMAAAACAADKIDSPAAQKPKATAATKPAAKQAKKVAPAASVPAASNGGLVVFIDPATGAIRQPDANEIRTLTGNSRSIQTLSEPAQFTLPNGATGVKLGADSMSYMVVTKASDGKLIEDCVTGEKAAKAVVAGRFAKPNDNPKSKELSHEK